jgi:hypothetical protein
MKWLKWWILAFLFGELLTLWRKDTKLQKAVSKEPSFGNKVKLMWKALFDFNKTIVEDAKQIDLQVQWMEVKQWFESELTELQSQITTWDTDIKNISHEQLLTFVKDMEARYSTLITKSKTWTKQIEEHPTLKEKLLLLQQAWDKIKKMTTT